MARRAPGPGPPGEPARLRGAHGTALALARALMVPHEQPGPSSSSGPRTAFRRTREARRGWRTLAALRRAARAGRRVPAWGRRALSAAGRGTLDLTALPVTPLLTRAAPRRTDSQREDPPVELVLRGTSVPLPRSRVGSFLVGAGVDLCLDTGQRAAWVGGRLAPLRHREVLHDLLLALADEAGAEVSTCRLFERVWRRPLRNVYDRKAVHGNVWRLRHALAAAAPAVHPIETTEDGYRLSPALRVARLGPVGVPDRVQDPHPVLALVRPGEVLEPRRVCRELGCSSATARRVMTRLTRAGLLVRVGAGRSTAYRRVD